MTGGEPGPARRALLAVAPNPAARLDYLVRLGGRVDWGAGVEVALLLVPDRLILEPAGWAAYLAGLGASSWPSLEALAAAILEDVANETVARWLRIEATAHPGGALHAVRLEDRQPKWDNRALLDHL